jgi:branched-chain amino acid transport system permease protein
MREGDEVPLALGKPVGSLRVRVMAVGGLLGGVAGALFAHYNAYISPEYFLPVETFIVWAMVILGGAGNFLGALVGTVVIQALYNSTRFLAPLLHIDAQVLGPLRMITIAVLIIMVILYLPHGMLPERRRRYGR